MDACVLPQPPQGGWDTVSQKLLFTFRQKIGATSSPKESSSTRDVTDQLGTLERLRDTEEELDRTRALLENAEQELKRIRTDWEDCGYRNIRA